MAANTIISAQELAAHLDDPDWRLFDCRHELEKPDAGEAAYRESHLPNAQFLHLERDLSGPKTGKNGRHPLPDPELLAAKLGQLGVSNNTQVVAYDNSGGMFAARLWWLLRWLGHENVAVLDGGIAAWRRAGQSLTAKVAAPIPAKFSWRLSREIVNADYVQAHLRGHSMLVIDARSPERFRGENETLDRVGGHIPGAINRFFKDNLTPDGDFKSAEQLQQEFESLLRGRPVETAVSQCGSGITACHNLLALEIAGLAGARLYPGSWSEWCSDPRRPIAKGAD